MGRFSDWSEKTRTLLREKSQVILGKIEGFSSGDKMLASLRRLRIPLLILIGFAFSAIMIEATFQYIIPTPKTKRAAPVTVSSKKLTYLQSKSIYEGIAQKNMFCPGCPIPDLESRKVMRAKDCNKAERLSGLAKIIGTIVLSNAKYSVATMSNGGVSKSYRIGDHFESYGTVFEIRRDRVCILKSDERLGYIEMTGVPQTLDKGMSTPMKTTTEGVSQTAENEFDIKRDYLMKSLQDLSVLQTAYATPYFEDNEIKGFRIQSIEPTSPLLALGVKQGDIITKADNQPITSVAKAQEILMGASTLDSLVISVLRNGSEVNLTYKVSK